MPEREPTLEEQYSADVREISNQHPPGSATRKRLKLERWDRLRARRFERDGNPAILHELQRRFATENLESIVAVYGGKIDAETYRLEKIRSGTRYARRLFELGLMAAVFDAEWIRDFVAEAIAFERDLVPLKTSGLTEADALVLCDPLRDLSKRFLEDVHEQFGLDPLKENAKIFGGVDARLCEAERRAARRPPIE